MSATLVGTLVALALLVIVVVAAAEWSLRHRTRRSRSRRSTMDASSPPTGRRDRR
jgi:hypothetical protein